jgi:hypothetical protein
LECVHHKEKAVASMAEAAMAQVGVRRWQVKLIEPEVGGRRVTCAVTVRR